MSVQDKNKIRKIAEAIYLSLKDKKDLEQKVVLGNIVKFLSRKHLLSKKKYILSALEEFIDKEDGRVPVIISSARILPERTKLHLADFLKQRYLAKKIYFNEKIDEKLIGGAKMEVFDEVIDLSTRHKIEKLKAHLTKRV